jgi:hypothetical protein
MWHSRCRLQIPFRRTYKSAFLGVLLGLGCSSLAFCSASSASLAILVISSSAILVSLICLVVVLYMKKKKHTNSMLKRILDIELTFCPKLYRYQTRCKEYKLPITLIVNSKEPAPKNHFCILRASILSNTSLP